MNDYPIIFNSEMIRAILDDRKTQTRRIIKPQPDTTHWKAEYIDKPKEWRPMVRLGPVHHGFDCDNWCLHDTDSSVSSVPYTVRRCPYGKVGDTLWVRETWAATSHQETPPPTADMILYKADGMKFDAGTNWSAYGYNIKWKPSIRMPKAACRIFLETTNIRVERVGGISDKDARAEGVIVRNIGDRPYHAFRDLWDSINAKRGPWKDNPWVWVVEFKRTEKPE